MRLLVTGGTGFIGAALCEALLQQGHELFVITRRPSAYTPQSHLQYVAWEELPSSRQTSTWQDVITMVDGVIHLAGTSIAAERWTPERKRVIRDSRVQTTRHLVEVLAERSPRPAVLIVASAVGYYGPRGDEEISERDLSGRGFLAETCRLWEAEAQRAEALGIRVLRLRLGLVLGPDGGALAKMVPPFRAWLGGPIGSGRQWISWIHREDAIGLIMWALGHPALAGPVNATAPSPVTMREFCRELAAVLRRPSWLPVPGAALHLLLGEMADLLLTGQRVMPSAALQHGYRFRFPELQHALASCLNAPIRASSQESRIGER